MASNDVPQTPNPDQFAALMRAAVTGDEEADHALADRMMVELLRDLGYGEAMDAYVAMPKWYA